MVPAGTGTTAQDANRRGRRGSGRAQLRSAAALWCARLRVAQSGLGRAGRWLVQAVVVATAAAKVTQGFAMGGRK